MRKSNEESLKEVLKAWIDSSNLKPKLNQTKIVKYWEDLMGPTIAGYTSQIFVVKNKLYIYIESAPLKQELNYAKEKIKSLMNEELGEEFILEVIIR